MNFSPFDFAEAGLWIPKKPAQSPAPPERAAARGRESPAAQQRPVPGREGVRPSLPAPTLTFPLRSAPRVHPLQPVSPAPGPAKPGQPTERGRREAGGMQAQE